MTFEDYMQPETISAAIPIVFSFLGVVLLVSIAGTIAWFIVDQLRNR